MDQEVAEWWWGVVTDPRFREVRKDLLDRRKHSQGIEETPHGQNVADGYRQGYSDCMENLEIKIPADRYRTGYAEPYLDYTVHPDLDDTKPSEKDARSSRKARIRPR